MQQLKQIITTLVALLALTAQATDYPTGLTDGQVLYVGDTFTPEVTYRLPNWSINSNIAPVKLVRFNVTPGERPWDRATLEEAADGQYYGFMDNDGDIRTYWDEYDNVLVGLGEYAFEATENSDGLIVTKSGANVSFALHEASNVAGKALSHNDDRTVWTLDAMLPGNVELQVEYYPGMLVKPTSLVGGTMEIEGVADTTLPDGFEKDDAGNIYVEAGKKFTVKAVPATGYHLVGWSDDVTIKDLEREFTMPADGSDFTVTATFSDQFELTFDDVNFKTNQNITVKVGDEAKTLDQDGKLSVKAGQTVTLTAKQGYKFRSVEAKKAGAAGPVTLAEATVGMLVGSDGMAYPADYKRPEGVFYRAVVAYKDGEHGLAITTMDQGGSGISDTWANQKSACEGNTAITGGTWRMASQDDWQQMFAANGGSNSSSTGLNSVITAAGGIATDGSYWTSTEESKWGMDGADFMYVNGSSVTYDFDGGLNNNRRARAVLAW